MVFLAFAVMTGAQAVPISPQQAQQNRIVQLFENFDALADGESDASVVARAYADNAFLLQCIYANQKYLPGSWNYVVAVAHYDYGGVWDSTIRQIDPWAGTNRWYWSDYPSVPTSGTYSHRYHSGYRAGY